MGAPKKSDKALAGIVVGVGIAVIAAGVIYFASQKSMADNITVNKLSGSTRQYRDGTYSADTTYYTPQSFESVHVQVVLTKGIITDVTVTQTPHNQEAAAYQHDFASNYKSQVVGRPIDSVALKIVAGSSLTPKGFNDALETIKSQAAV